MHGTAGKSRSVPLMLFLDEVSTIRGKMCSKQIVPTTFCEPLLLQKPALGRDRLTLSRHSTKVCTSRNMYRINLFCATKKYQNDSRIDGKRPPLIPQVVIIGGGAAGHMAAISCSRRVQQNASVFIVESSKTVLDKVRISGGGRCNVTSALDAEHNRSFVSHYPRGRQEMLSVIASFSSSNTISFFEEEGVRLKTEPTGKVFPISNSSETVVNALAMAARKNGVRVLTSTRVVDLKRISENTSDSDGVTHTFQLKMNNEQTIDADFVVVATGSARVPWTWASAMGHRVLSGVPSLFTFKVQSWKWGELSGISVDDVNICLCVDQQTKRRVSGLSQRGPILITHWGFSGPAVLSLSAFGARVFFEHKYNLECSIDWVPSMSLQEKEEAVGAVRKSQKQKHVDASCPFWKQIPKRLWRALVEEALDSADNRASKAVWGSLSNKDVTVLVSRLHDYRIQIQGRGEFKEEFVTAGGIAVSDVDTKTFESKHVKGLYFAGETLNVDGCTGGYNLQFAWSSGFIAGNAIADCINAALKVGKLADR